MDSDLYEYYATQPQKEIFINHGEKITKDNKTGYLEGGNSARTTGSRTTTRRDGAKPRRDGAKPRRDGEEPDGAETTTTQNNEKKEENDRKPLLLSSFL